MCIDDRKKGSLLAGFGDKLFESLSESQPNVASSYEISAKQIQTAIMQMAFGYLLAAPKQVVQGLLMLAEMHSICIITAASIATLAETTRRS